MDEVTVQDFLRSFPEFASGDVAKVVSYLEQVQIEACYDEFEDPRLTALAVKLHTAHLITACEQAESNAKFNGQKVTKLKTKHDEIQYAVDASDPFSFNHTQYGRRLQDLLDRNIVGFTLNLTAKGQNRFANGNLGFGRFGSIW